MTPASLRPRIEQKLLQAQLLARSLQFRRTIAVEPRDDLVHVGTRGYGDWELPASLLGPEARCLCAGVGEDVAFDLALIARFGCTIHAVDPMPRAAAYAAVATAYEPRFRYAQVALWSSDTTLAFHAPAVEGHVSHSATNMHDTPVALEAQARSVRSLMDEHGFDGLDLLKISAEGAEYEILDHVLAEGIDVRILCVEFSQPADRSRVEAHLDRLRRAGYAVVSANVKPRHWSFTTVAAGS